MGGCGEPDGKSPGSGGPLGGGSEDGGSPDGGSKGGGGPPGISGGGRGGGASVGGMGSGCGAPSTLDPSRAPTWKGDAAIERSSSGVSSRSLLATTGSSNGSDWVDGSISASSVAHAASSVEPSRSQIRQRNPLIRSPCQCERHGECTRKRLCGGEPRASVSHRRRQRQWCGEGCASVSSSSQWQPAQHPDPGTRQLSLAAAGGSSDADSRSDIWRSGSISPIASMTLGSSNGGGSGSEVVSGSTFSARHAARAVGPSKSNIQERSVLIPLSMSTMDNNMSSHCRRWHTAGGRRSCISRQTSTRVKWSDESLRSATSVRPVQPVASPAQVSTAVAQRQLSAAVIRWRHGSRRAPRYCLRRSLDLAPW